MAPGACASVRIFGVVSGQNKMMLNKGDITSSEKHADIIWKDISVL
jgi:hypothetical protein